MKELFQKMMKKLRKHSEAAGAIAALLLIVLFSGVMILGIRTQRESVPENPIDGMKKSSMVMLTGTKEVLAEQTKENGSSRQQMQNQQSENQDMPETESESSKESGADSQGTESTGSGSKNENGSSTEANRDASGNNSGNSSGTASGTNGGNYGDGTGGEKTDGDDKNNKKPNKNHSGNKNKDKNGKKDRQYFRTTIENGGTVTKADYSYQIEQLTDLKVLKTENTLNDGKVTTYRGSLKLAHGENKILVAVTYQQKDGTKFTVSKEYTIYYDEEKLLIKTNLSDQTVKSDHISFRAWAQLGKETFALTATLNGTPISADENWDYKDVPLQEGENQIVLDAEKDGKSEQQVYTITYERPQNQNIRFDTDLEDKEVYKKKYRFYAQAFMGSDKVEDLTAWLNGTQLSPTDGDNYEVLLEEGENQITLYAEKNGSSEEITYTVTYVKQNSGDGDGEGNVEAPRVTCTLGDSGNSLETQRKSLSFQVQATDYHGNGLGADNIRISCFGDSGDNITGLIWENSGDVSYHTELSQGYNTMVITVTDAEDNTTELTYSIFCTAAESGERIGTVHISVEATTVGSGILLSQDVDIYEGETAAETVVRMLQNNGYSVDYTGNYETGFYLARISSESNFVTGNIPEDLRTKLEEHGFEIYDFTPNSLGDYDFTKGSGWMYQVNGVYPNYGLSDYCFQNGDTLRLRFTLAYGADIGQDMTGGSDNWGYEW